MAARTRPGSSGHGTRRNGSFSGRTGGGGGGRPHNGKVTRPISSGHGSRVGGSFSGRAPGGGGGSSRPHNGQITRPSSGGYGTRVGASVPHAPGTGRDGLNQFTTLGAGFGVAYYTVAPFSRDSGTEPTPPPGSYRGGGAMVLPNKEKRKKRKFILDLIAQIVA